MGRASWPLVATTIPGLEPVAIREIGELTGREAHAAGTGRVGLDGGGDEIFQLNYRSKSLHRVFLVLKAFDVERLEHVYEAVRGLGFPDLMDAAQPFAVRARRRGTHAFSSMDVERVAGQAVIDSFQDRGRLRPPVRLDDPEVSVYVEVHDGGFWVGLDTTGPRSLHQRDYRICDHPAPLRSTLAYGMVRLSGWSPEESFMDPMCGSGTICIEAGHWANRVPNWFRSDLAYARLPFLDQARLTRMKREADGTVVAAGRSIHGCDVSAGHVLRAEENARHAGVPCHLFSGDALRVSLDCDRIVTNPPFGFRMGSRKRVEALYRAFMDRLDRHDWKSAVILTGRPDLLPVPAEATRVQVRIGNLPASIWVVKRDPAGSAVGP